jgi:hypothetical protein
MNFGASCSRKAVSTQPPPLAKVGNHEIQEQDFLQEVERWRKAGRAIPDKETVLQEMVNFEALVQRAEAAGLDKDPRLQREFGKLLIGKLFERELDPRIAAMQVTPDEVKAEYDRNIAKYTRPAQVRLAMLFLQADSKMSEAKRAELRARLEEARRKVMENPPHGGRGAAAGGFGALAIDYSDDQASRYRGGDIGWMDPDKLSSRCPRKVIELGCALDKGKRSEVIEVEGGFYVVMKTDAREASVMSLQKAEPALRQDLLLKKRRDLEAAYRKESAQWAGVSINREALASVKLSSGAEAQAEKAEPSVFPTVNDSEQGH